MIQIVEKGYQLTVTPGSILDYGFDYTAWLAGDTIIASAWQSSLTETNPNFTTTSTVVFLSGFVSGNTYTATNTITTSSNPARTTTRSWILVCE